MSPKKIDRPLLITICILLIVGFFIFCSASLGLLARNGATFSSVAFNQIFFGLFIGGISCFVVSQVPFKFWKRYSLHFLILSLILTAAVFIPGLGFSHGGARRWLHLGPYSFQPAEFLKLAFVIYMAAWLSTLKQDIKEYKYGLIPLMFLFGIVGIVMLLQPDTDTYGVMIFSALAMYVVAGSRWRDIGILFLIGIIALGSLIMVRPYLKERVMTFINPGDNPLGSGYQIQQSLIAIGSGQITGRGFGQSIQKFNFLPEPIGDSIFAVAAEEFGFLGSITLIFLFVYLTLRGFKIASLVPDSFGALLVVGLMVLIISQAFINIASMLSIIPLSGLPLLFVSHGGTALFFTLTAVGILFNISKYQKTGI